MIKFESHELPKGEIEIIFALVTKVDSAHNLIPKYVFVGILTSCKIRGCLYKFLRFMYRSTVNCAVSGKWKSIYPVIIHNFSASVHLYPYDTVSKQALVNLKEVRRAIYTKMTPFFF